VGRVGGVATGGPPAGRDTGERRGLPSPLVRVEEEDGATRATEGADRGAELFGAGAADCCGGAGDRRC